MMTSRQRVQSAIDLRPPDRPPLNMDMSVYAWRALLEHMGLPTSDVPAPSLAMEVVPDPAVLSALGIDIISVKPGEPRFLRSGSLDELPEVSTDQWGVTRRLVPHPSGAYYEIVSHPLAGADTATLESYAWPDCVPDDVDESLRDRARALCESTDLALMGRFGGPILEIAAALLGMEEWYVRLVEDAAFIRVLLDRIGRICTAQDERGINSCGQFLQIMKVSGEDLGMQSGLLYSPPVIDGILLPPLKRRWRKVRERLAEVNPETKIMLHSCGAVSALVPALIDAGIDILDPVQPNAASMDPQHLQSSFGDRIAFHGGIDIQQLLPFGTAAEVRRRTTEVLDGFQAADGGFIAAPSHCVQPDVPPQNLLAMIDAARDYRRPEERGS